MPFKKSQSAVNIGLGVFLGAELFFGLNITIAQSLQYSCLPNQNGDGWVCENLGSIQSSDSTDAIGRYTSSSAVLRHESDTLGSIDDSQINQTESPLLSVNDPKSIAEQMNSPREPHTPSEFSSSQANE